MGFSWQEYLSELPCPPPEDLPDPGIKPTSPAAPAVQEASLPLSYGEAQTTQYIISINLIHSLKNKNKETDSNIQTETHIHY